MGCGPPWNGYETSTHNKPHDSGKRNGEWKEGGFCLHHLPKPGEPDLCCSAMQLHMGKLSKGRKRFLAHQDPSLARAGSCGVEEGLGFWTGGDQGICFITSVKLCVFLVRAL